MSKKRNNGRDFEFIINDAYEPYLEDTRPLQIFFGGSSSGKSTFLAQRAIYDLLNSDRNYLIVRQVASTLLGSVYNELNKVIDNIGAKHLFKTNQTLKRIVGPRGTQIICCGADDVEKIKSTTPRKGVLTDIWIEEATETAQPTVKQLSRRLRGKGPPKRLTMSFNPIYKRHWIYKDYFDGVFPEKGNLYETEDILILKTTYKDNILFLDDYEIKVLENESDPYWHEVYTLGNWGVLGGLIFNNWEIVDLKEEDIKKLDTFRYGLDFGFSIDPNAFVVAALDKTNREIYVIKEFIAKEISDEVLADEIRADLNGSIVFCDAHQAKSIDKLKSLGIAARGADKGPGSVRFGIKWLQGYKIYINSTCQETINEFATYQWKKTKDGETLSMPIKKNDHVIDALRYAFSEDMIEHAVSDAVITQRSYVEIPCRTYW